MRLRYTNKKQLEEAIIGLRDALSANRDFAKITLTHDLVGHLGILDVCSDDLSKIGGDKLKQIKEIVGEEKISPEVANCNADILGLRTEKELERGQIDYGLRTLSTYNTLLKYQEKIDESNRVKNIEKILGEQK